MLPESPIITIVHAFIVTTLTWRSLKSSFGTHFDLRAVATFLLYWANVLGATFLAWGLGSYENDYAYLACSLAILILTTILFARYAKPFEIGESSFADRAWLWKDRGLFERLILVALAGCFLGNLLLSFLVGIQIPDSFAIKLPSAFFYLNTGELIPDRDNFRDRFFMAPFNVHLLWGHFMRWGGLTRFLMLANALSAIACFVFCFRFSRRLGLKEWPSLLGALCFCLTTTMIFQVITDNDDLISSIPGLLGLLFFVYWIDQPKNLPLACLTGIGVGIGVASKGFPLLFAPVILLLPLYWLLFKRRELISWIQQAGWSALISGIMFSVFCGVYHLTLYLEFGRFLLAVPIHKDIHQKSIWAHDQTIYNWVGNHAQIWLNGIPDFLSYSTGASREAIVNFFNNTILPALLPSFGVNNGHGYGPDLTSVHVHDGTTWYGLIMLFLMPYSLYMLTRKRLWGSKTFWAILAFWSWGFVMSAARKYIPGIGRYWIMPVALLFTTWGWWLQSSLERKDLVSLLRRGVFYLCVVSTVWFNVAALTRTELRSSLSNIWDSEIWAEKDFGEDYNQVLQSAERINFIKSVYSWPLWFHLKGHRGKDVSYTHDYRSDALNVLPTLLRAVLYAPGSSSHFGVPVDNAPSQLRFLDPRTEAFGYELFLKAPQEEGACEACHVLEDLLLIRVAAVNSLDIFKGLSFPQKAPYASETDVPFAEVAFRVEGLTKGDAVDLEFRVVLREIDSQRVLSKSPWSSLPERIVKAPLEEVEFEFQARDKKSGEIYSSFIPLYRTHWGKERYRQWRN